MLWNVVYDFFVKYVFGGHASNGLFYSSFISLASYSEDDGELILGNYNLGNMYAKLGFTGYDMLPQYITLGDYLSLIATIISMVVIVVLACLFVKKVYNMVAHVIG